MNNKLIYSFIAFAAGLFLLSCSNADDYTPNINTGQIENVGTIYSESFSESLGDFTTQSIVGNESWGFDNRKYAKMTGYVNPTTSNANEDWLISPVIDLTKQTAANFSFDYVTYRFSNTKQETTIWISENYTEGAAPNTAEWTNLNVSQVNSSTWDFLNSGQISLTKYIGKKVNIAFKYLSTTSSAGTWEIKNFLVQSGEAVNKDNGKGTKSSPYNIEGAIKKISGLAWVQGYIVGYVNTVAGNVPVFNANNATVKTNILISDTKDNLYAAKTLLIDLSNSVIQNALNLNTNPALFNKKITVYGTLGKSLGYLSLNSTSYYVLEDGTSGGVLPPEPILEESFELDSGDFITENVKGEQFWNWERGYMKMTGFVNPANNENEDWLISPQADLTGISNAKLTFDHVIRYTANPTLECTVWISTNYTKGSPTTATWTQLSPPTPFFNANNWNFGTSGVINLSDYANKKINIGFKYLSTTTRAGTWEIKNFYLYK